MSKQTVETAQHGPCDQPRGNLSCRPRDQRSSSERWRDREPDARHHVSKRAPTKSRADEKPSGNTTGRRGHEGYSADSPRGSEVEVKAAGAVYLGPDVQAAQRGVVGHQKRVDPSVPLGADDLAIDADGCAVVDRAKQRLGLRRCRREACA